MASGPYWNPKRGTWSVQWKDGDRWCRTVVVKKRPGWKPGDPPPRKPPPEAMAAVAIYDRRERQSTGGKWSVKSLEPGTWLRAWLADRAGITPETRRKAGKAIEVFAAWCQANGVHRVDHVDREACKRFLADRARTLAMRSGEPIEFATRETEKALLAKAWSDALEDGSLPTNPWFKLKTPGKQANRRRGSWSPEEFARLLAVSAVWLKDLLIVGVNTGLRIEALRGLEWKHIRFAAANEPGFGWIDVPPELDKTHKGYTVPISAACHDVLARRRAHKDSHVRVVLTGGRGNVMSGRSGGTGRAIYRACRRAGLPKPNQPNHHMRRTFGRWAVLGHLTGSPIPIYVVSRWMGHASIDMTEHYLQLSDRESQRYMLGSDDRTDLGQASGGQA